MGDEKRLGCRPTFGGWLPSFFIALLLAGAALGQEAPPPAEKEEPGIQDNSFLIEESYNQERGVVQHISQFIRSFDTGYWIYTFTQEWPVPGIKHQLSYTLPLQDAGGRGARLGFGDIALNYRYQLLGSGDAKVALAPRVSLLAPTGDVARSYGSGGLGFQANVPLSLVLGPRFVTHWNLGATFVPRPKDAAGDHATTVSYNVGESVVWLAHPRFNVLFEAVFLSTESVVGPKATSRVGAWLLSPGIRWAYNFRSGLQIVSGLAVPLTLGSGPGTTSLLLYLSFEHPFRKKEE